MLVLVIRLHGSDQTFDKRHEATRFAGFGAEIAARIQKECFWNLEAPIGRVAGWDTPYPHAFEWQYFPGQDRVIAALNKVLER